MKIFEKSDPEFIRYQIKIIDFLAKNKIPVAKICKLNNEKEILIYNNKRILTHRFIEGKTKERYNEKLLKDIARNFGLMSKSLLKLKIKDKSHWKKDYQFKSYSQHLKIKSFNFGRHAMQLSRDLNFLKRNKLRKSVIHGDFHGVNLLVKGNKLKSIVDFDDSHNDYIAYEVAVFLIDPFITEKSFNKKHAKIFFKEFQKHVRLNNEEKMALYYFVKHRLLGIMAWICQKKRMHQDHKERLDKSLNKMISKFNSFEKVALEEFVELLY